MSDSFSHRLSPAERRVVWWGIGVMAFTPLYFTAGPCLAFTTLFLAFIAVIGHKQAERERAALANETVPTFEFLAAPTPDEPLIRLLPGQELVLCRPVGTQVAVPRGVRLEILEANGELLRVRAVAASEGASG